MQPMSTPSGGRVRATSDRLPKARHGFLYILRIDTLCLESIYPQLVVRFSQPLFGPQNVPQVAHNIVSFGLNLSSRRGKDGQISMIEGPLHSLKRCEFGRCSLALPPQEDCNYRITH
jgi:hypothetical protein